MHQQGRDREGKEWHMVGRTCSEIDVPACSVEA